MILLRDIKQGETMPTVELGSDFSVAEEESKKAREKLPADAYDLMCTACEVVESKKGTPQLRFSFEVQNNANPDFNGKKISHWCPLPHEGQAYLGFLVDVINALGKPWQGASLDTEDYPTRSCIANIVIDGDYNRIKGFV